MPVHATRLPHPSRAHRTGVDDPPPVADTVGADRRSAVVRAGGVFQQLSGEWARLCSLPSTARTVQQWSRTEAVLAARTLGAVLDDLDTADAAGTDAQLLALLRLAQGGQQLAGRVVLQAMLPKLARIVRTKRTTISDDHRLEDRRHVAVATIWEVLLAYPVTRRPRQVAANLALDTLHRLTEDSRRPPADIPVDPQDATERLARHTYQDPPATAGHLTADADLLEVIAWAVDVAAISREDADLLTRVYLPASAGGQAAAADELGLTHAALRQRCTRARRRLTAAVRADALTGARAHTGAHRPPVVSGDALTG